MSKTKKEYLIPVSFEMCGMLVIRAESAKQAIKLAEENIDMLPIPSNKSYVDGSYRVETDPDIINIYTNNPKTCRNTAEPVML